MRKKIIRQILYLSLLNCLVKRILKEFIVPINREGILGPHRGSNLKFQTFLAGLADAMVGNIEESAAIIRIFQFFLADITRYVNHKSLQFNYLDYSIQKLLKYVEYLYERK